jgi:hypothetical protein
LSPNAGAAADHFSHSLQVYRGSTKQPVQLEDIPGERGEALGKDCPEAGASPWQKFFSQKTLMPEVTAFFNSLVRNPG